MSAVRDELKGMAVLVVCGAVIAVFLMVAGLAFGVVAGWMYAGIQTDRENLMQDRCMAGNENACRLVEPL